MSRPALQIVAGTATKPGIWQIADDESDVVLVVDGAVVARVSPWTDDRTGKLAWWTAMAGERELGLDGCFEALCNRAAAQLGIAAPVSRELLASLRLEPLPAMPPAESASDASLLERFADLVARILDEPLAILPGRDPADGAGTTELRLSHYRPELSERAAALLEEAGR